MRVPFPWEAFEWVIKYYDPQHIRLYTLSEAQALCRDIGFQVVLARPFQIDLFCQGWVLCMGYDEIRAKIGHKEKM